MASVSASRGMMQTPSIGLEHGHRAADGDHVLAQRLDFGGHELAEQAHFVHHIADHCGEEFGAAEGEEFVVGIPKGHGGSGVADAS